jgi:hypothetical protein
MEAIHTSTHDDSSGTANETSDKITGKPENEMRQARTHIWALGTSPKLKSLQDLSIRVNPKVTECNTRFLHNKIYREARSALVCIFGKKIA